MVQKKPYGTNQEAHLASYGTQANQNSGFTPSCLIMEPCNKSSYDALPCNSKWIDWFIIFQVEDVVVTVPFPKQVLNVNLTPSGEVSICYMYHTVI